MTSQPAPNGTKMRRVALGLLAFVLLVGVLAATKTWLKATIGGPMFNLVVAAVTILGMLRTTGPPRPPRAGQMHKAALSSPRGGAYRPGRPRSCCCYFCRRLETS